MVRGCITPCVRSALLWLLPPTPALHAEAGWEAVGDLDMSDVYGVEQASSPSLDQGPDGPSASGEDSPATPGALLHPPVQHGASCDHV